MPVLVRRTAETCLWLLGFTFLVCFFSLPCQQALGKATAVSFRDLKYRGTVAQTTDYSCGAAALACLLQMYYGIQATELEVLELAERQMLARGAEPEHAHGLTAYDLRAASEALGLATAGYKLTLAQLEDYFQRGGLPLIAHVTQPQNHYVVVVGVATDHILLADPAWGRYIAPLQELVDSRAMSGVFLVPLPASEVEALHAQGTQEAALAWMCGRLSQLRALREDML